MNKINKNLIIGLIAALVLAVAGFLMWEKSGVVEPERGDGQVVEDGKDKQLNINKTDFNLYGDVNVEFVFSYPKFFSYEFSSSEYILENWSTGVCFFSDEAFWFEGGEEKCRMYLLVNNKKFTSLDELKDSLKERNINYSILELNDIETIRVKNAQGVISYFDINGINGLSFIYGGLDDKLYDNVLNSLNKK